MRKSSFVIAALMVATAGGELVAQAGKPPKGRGKVEVAAPMVWPPPPEPPRVLYLTAYHGAGDFNAKKPGRWKTALLGNAQDGGPSDSFVKPYAVAVSPLGRIYVSDTAARRVFAIDPDKSTLNFIGDRGSTALTKPVGVAVDANGTVFVADATLKRVFGFAPEGNVIISIGREGELESPSGITIDRTRKLLYVVDSSRHQIVVYSTTDGTRLRVIGKRGGDQGQFNFPTNATVDRAGRLYVADTLNFRVQIFEADGKFVRMFGTLGDSPGTFNRPKGVAVDSEGHIYVADTAFDNFQIFDAEGKLLLFVGRGGGQLGQFILPAGLYIDERDQIYVADQGNSRVQVFQYVRADTR
jgi:sugar lactone lactonase YvrE